MTGAVIADDVLRPPWQNQQQANLPRHVMVALPHC